MYNCRQRARQQLVNIDAPIESNNRAQVRILMNPHHPLREGVENWDITDPVLAIAPNVTVKPAPKVAIKIE